MRKSRTCSHVGATGLIILAIGLGLSGGPGQTAHADTLTVNTASPFIVSDGLCSLFEAIINANDDLQTHADCPAGSEDDVIELGSGEIYNITFPHNINTRNCLPVITSTITIEGHGATIQRDRLLSPTCRIFRVMENGGDLTLRDLIVRDGRSADAGGIFNTGAVRLFNSTLIDNSGGVGGMLNQGKAELTDSAVIGNIAEGVGGGGGIANNRGTLTLTSTTVGGNRAAPAAAGGFGGGIFNFDGMVFLNNSTISSNTSDNPGGGVSNSPGGVVQMQNTILAGNFDDFPSQDAPNCSGELTSLGHNFLGELRGCTVARLDTDLMGDPELDGLTDNGTPGNAHFPLLADSPAIDRGNDDVCPPTDQLGQARAGSCDMGAIEGGIIADLSLTKADGTDPVTLGDEILYTLTVTSHGPNDAQNVVVTDILPAGATFVSATSDQGTCSEVGGVVTCELGAVDNGTSVSIDILVIATTDGTLENTASVASDTTDPNVDNNSATELTTVAPTPCVLDVDMNGIVDVATDVVYIARHLLGLDPVPLSFRIIDPSIPSDDDIWVKVDAIGPGLDVDMNGVVNIATDVVYIARHLLGLAPVPPAFRVIDPTIPSDAEIRAKIAALCPSL